MIVKQNDQLRKHIGEGIISASLDGGRILAFVSFGVGIVAKAVGIDLIKEIDALVTRDAKQQALFEHLEKTIAWYAYSKYLPFATGTDGDSGLQETSTDKTTPTRLGVIDKRQKATDENAANSLEDLLIFLFDNASDYETYANSDEFIEYKELIVRNGRELKRALPASNGSYRFYLTLKAYIQEEQDKVVKFVGNTLLEAVLEKLNANTLKDEPIYKNAYLAISKYICRLAYLKALPRLVVVQSENGLRVLSEFDGINDSKTPTAAQYELLRDSLERSANEAYNDMIDYLSANVDDLAGFETEGAYVAPGTSQPRFLKERKRLIGL